MNFKKIISELKRRNVFKVATAYAITAWLIIQIVSVIKEPLLLPDWFDKTVIVLFLIGFPIALIFAWAFELTPDGLKKTEQVVIEESTTKDTGKRLNKIIITTLLVLIAFLLYDKFFLRDSIDEELTPSIAVLPFADLSPKNDQEYFSDGLSEELLNVLASVSDMKVAARTSSFKFKGKNDDLKRIGKELGVAHILEGSVRKSGDKIRITAQLIKVDDGFHMWSDTYDRDYNASNLFKIQDEISKEVMNRLKVTLLNDSLAIKKVSITKNTKAYEHYLKGNQLVINRNPKEIEQAVEEYKKAIKLDTEFAHAHARLSIAYYHLISYAGFNYSEGGKLMKKYADKAILLDNTLGITYAALAHCYSLNLEQENTLLAHKMSYELSPNDAEIIMWYASSLNFQTEKELKTKLLKEAYAKDPLAPIVMNNLADDFKRYGEYEKAKEIIKENIRINPNYTAARVQLIDILADEPFGNLDEAFIAAHKAYLEIPKDVKILESLAIYAAQLNISGLYKKVKSELLASYPSYKNGFNQLEFVEMSLTKDKRRYQKVYGETLREQYKSVTGEQRIHLDNFLSLIADEYQDIIKRNNKFYPGFKEDTITIITDKTFSFYPQVLYALDKTNQIDKYNRLKNLYIQFRKKRFKMEDDYSTEVTDNLFRHQNIAMLNKNYQQVADILNEIYFKRKELSYFYNTWADLVILELMDKKPIQDVFILIDQDMERMKSNAVKYLKENNYWQEEWN